MTTQPAEQEGIKPRLKRVGCMIMALAVVGSAIAGVIVVSATGDKVLFLILFGPAILAVVAVIVLAIGSIIKDLWTGAYRNWD